MLKSDFNSIGWYSLRGPGYFGAGCSKVQARPMETKPVNKIEI